MRVAQLYKGIYHFGMSGWYHLGAALAGLTINCSQVEDFYVFQPGSQLSFIEIKESQVMTELRKAIMFHMCIAILMLISTLLNMKGRHANELVCKPQSVNSYLLAQRAIDVIASAIWLQYICYLSYWCYSFQVCLYNAPFLGTTCYYWFTPPIVYIVFTLNSAMCYMFGIVTFIIVHILVSSCRNRVINDF